MLARYKSSGGRLVKTADVYVKREHGIDRNLIDQDAVKIVARLRKYDHSAYVVGGAVRDLLVGKRPKDFDIVTDAEPNQIRKLFRNSRVIGKRFRLVHIFFQDDKIIEVSTFRAADAAGFNNVYGTIEEDAWRRDFSLNALFYDPLEEKILDFTRGYRDIKAKRLKPIIPMDRIFIEDPVRMIRAIKYSVTTGCRMGFFLKRQIRRSCHLLADVSPSRVSEEAFKIWQGGYSHAITKTLQEYGLLKYMMPRLAELLDSKAVGIAGGRVSGAVTKFSDRFFSSLESLDKAVRGYRETRRFIQLSYLLSDYLYFASKWCDVKKLPFAEVYHDIKDLLRPVTPPNVEVERALVYLIRKRKAYQSLGALPVFDPTNDAEDMAAAAKAGGEMQREDRRNRRGRGPRGAGPVSGEANAEDGETSNVKPSAERNPVLEGAPPPKKKRSRGRRGGSGRSKKSPVSGQGEGDGQIVAASPSTTSRDGE